MLSTLVQIEPSAQVVKPPDRLKKKTILRLADVCAVPTPLKIHLPGGSNGKCLIGHRLDEKVGVKAHES